MPDNQIPTTQKPWGRQLRDPKGQVIGLMSMVYVFLTIAYLAWVMNSGMALCYKTKMMSTCQQAAATGAVFMYYAPYYGWSFGEVQPYLEAGTVGQPGFVPNTFVGTATAFYPSLSYSQQNGNSITVALNGSITGYDNWVLPGSISDVRTFAIPSSLPAPSY